MKGKQYSDKRESAGAIPQGKLNRTNNMATSVVASVASPTTIRFRSRRIKRSRKSRCSSGSSSSCFPSELPSASCGISERSPSKSHGSHSIAKDSFLHGPCSTIANPSTSAYYLPCAVNTSAINYTSNITQGSMLTEGCPLDSLQINYIEEVKMPLGICVQNLPVQYTDTSLKDELFHEYKKHGNVTMVKVIGQGTERYAVVCFKKAEDVYKALEVSKDKLLFGCKLKVTAHEGLDAADNEFQPLEAQLDEFHPKATRTLFIGNLGKDITTAELRKHFDEFGEIIEIDIKKQDSAASYAFIQYSDIISVVKAIRNLDGKYLGANRIKLAFGKSIPTNCVWLDGIIESISNKFLALHFNRFGLVVYAAVDRKKGHALIFYESVDIARMAVSKMRGRVLLGKKLQVDFASRECQVAFFDKLENTGQMNSGDGSQT